MITGPPHQIVKPRSFAPEHNYGIGLEVVAVVIHRAALVEADAPQVAFLEGFERADEVNHAGQAEVLGGTGRGLDSHRAERGGTALGEQNPVHTSSFSGAQQCAQVLRVLDAIEGENQAGFSAFEQIFDAEEIALPDDGHHPLMARRTSQSREGFARLFADLNACSPAESQDLVEAMGVAMAEPLACDTNMIEAPAAGTQSLLDRM